MSDRKERENRIDDLYERCGVSGNEQQMQYLDELTLDYNQSHNGKIYDTFCDTLFCNGGVRYDDASELWYQLTAEE